MLSLSFLTLSLAPFHGGRLHGSWRHEHGKGRKFPTRSKNGNFRDAAPRDSKLNYNNNDEKLRRRAHPSVVTSSAASASQAAAGGRAGGRRRQACRHSFRPRNEAAAATAKGRRTDAASASLSPAAATERGGTRSPPTAPTLPLPSFSTAHDSRPPSLTLSFHSVNALAHCTLNSHSLLVRSPPPLQPLCQGKGQK